MRKKFTVSRLEEIAFMASYREILSNLLLCPDHRPEERRNMNTYSSLISLNPFLTSPNVLHFVRSRLNQHLIGTMNDDIRKRLVHEYNQNFYDSEQKCDIWAFFDCVLDPSFTELDTHVVFPQTEPNEKAIQTVAKRSPNVEILKLNFEMVMTSTPVEKLKPVVVSLSGLNNLSSLSLYFLDKHHRSLLSYVGYSCPKLQHICISGFKITKKDIVALVLGEKLEFLQEKETLLKEENDIHHLQISPEYLAPFCSTLQLLQLENFDEKKKLQKSCEYSSLPPTAAAFAIRNMPNLRRIDHSSSSISSAVKLLSQISKANEIVENNIDKFHEEQSHDSRMGCPPSLPWKTNLPLSGILFLTNLDFVNLGSLDMMRAVGQMCPSLKEVTFCDLKHTDNVSPDQLVSVLTMEWPKVERVTFMKVSTIYRKAVLTSIGAQLLHVTFVSCESIEIADLSPCTQLEVLRIFFSSSLLKDENQSITYSDSETFLPKLDRLESDICLGEISRIFEEKSSVTHLDLECCHVNTKANAMNWNDIVKCWQRIHTLRIRRCTGLNMAMAECLSLQMPKLRELTLPSLMLNSKNEREMSFELMDYFNKRPLKIRLKFERSQSSIECPYQLPGCAYETSEEELSNDSDESSHHNRGHHLGFDTFEIDHGDWVDDIDVFVDDGEDIFDDGDDDFGGDDFGGASGDEEYW